MILGERRYTTDISAKIARENCSESTKNVCQRLFFNKVTCLRPETLLKVILWHRCFPVNFVEFLRTLFFIEHLWWLHLKISEDIII